MSAVVVPWLPAASRADLERAMRWLVERWLSEWTAAPHDVVVAAPTSGGVPAGIVAGDDDLVALGFVASAGHADLSNAIDRRVLLHVGAAMRDDLSARLAGAGSGTDTDTDRVAHRFAVASRGGGWSLTLGIAEGAMVAVRRRCAGTTHASSLSALRIALAAETVSLGCHLGEARITAAELAALDAGDVLVLDRALGDAVPLTVEGRTTASGRARIAARGGAVEVRLTHPPSLQEL
ncbi:FliM/FliN family flagellar motor C-terminal domain-containing protein [Sphingomonas adhaesiva]|uniref:FliM/FliN family flagellar motor C-terminal domain-containing protein n=1 Tax=Sphingomonas adhaesiva TaxID=28212 RepID=UPI002FFC474F